MKVTNQSFLKPKLWSEIVLGSNLNPNFMCRISVEAQTGLLISKPIFLFPFSTFSIHTGGCK